MYNFQGIDTERDCVQKPICLQPADAYDAMVRGISRHRLLRGPTCVPFMNLVMQVIQ